LKSAIKSFYKSNKNYICFLLIFFAFRWSFADHTRVPTGSMEPTIAVGDHLIINKLAYDFKIPFTQFKVLKIDNPEAGDIITFTPPHDPKTTYVKRLIAGPGDKVEVKDGFVKVNGKSLIQEKLEITQPIFSYQESLNGHTYTVARDLLQARPQELSLIVPKDKYFFMGDNRDNSLDSRAWGFVDRSQILAKAERVLFSVRLKNYLPSVNLMRTLKVLD
jgi:signal peptidase I